MGILSVKALHIIFVVTWFAGLFYSFRLFVYFSETQAMERSKAEVLREQYTIMIRRLWYIITWPSAIITLVFGLWLLIDNPIHLDFPYMWVKLAMVFLLYLYQFYGEMIVRKVSRGAEIQNSTTFRLLNEVPTVILIAVVFLIVLKNAVSWIWGVIGILGVAIALMLAVRLYKKLRERDK